MLFMCHEIHERERDGTVVLDLKGRLGLGSEDSALRQHLQALIEAGKKNVIINLQHVTAIDAATVDSLSRYAEDFQKAGGRLVLLNPVREHLSGSETLELDTALPAYTDEQDAVNSFYPDRKVPHYDLLEFLEEETHHPKPELQEKQE